MVIGNWQQVKVINYGTLSLTSNCQVNITYMEVTSAIMILLFNS